MCMCIYVHRCLHTRIYIEHIHSIYTITCICILVLFFVWRRLESGKNRASASSITKTPSSCHHFSRYGRHDACSQLSVFANTELLRPEDRGQSVVLGFALDVCSVRLVLFCSVYMTWYAVRLSNHQQNQQNYFNVDLVHVHNNLLLFTLLHGSRKSWVSLAV